MMMKVFQNTKHVFEYNFHATLHARLLPDMYSKPICWQICTADIL